jgi:hypothetical protein
VPDTEPARESPSALVEAEMRKVCERGHSLGWVPWFAQRSPVLGHCLCGAPYHRETRGPKPLDISAFNAAVDRVVIDHGHAFDEASVGAVDLAQTAIRAYLNELEEFPNPGAAGA